MDPNDYTSLFSEHADYLWGLCYRMTGSTTDAEDLVQETFARALVSPPPDATRPWRPWLTTVATRLSIDALRRRSRRAYTGPWLPMPVQTPEGSAALEPIAPGPDVEARLGTLESLSIGFLLALEVLSPRQRAVLLLRDAFGYSGPEVAQMLELSPDNVRVTLLRARRAIADARGRPLDPAASHPTAVVEALARFMTAVVARDMSAVQACLAEDVVVRSDGGGQYLAALQPITGADRVARFYLGVLRHGRPRRVEVRPINGTTGFLVELDVDRPRAAPRMVVTIELDADGRIAVMHAVMASAKLRSIAFG